MGCHLTHKLGREGCVDSEGCVSWFCCEATSSAWPHEILYLSVDFSLNMGELEASQC